MGPTNCQTTSLDEVKPVAYRYDSGRKSCYPWSFTHTRFWSEQRRPWPQQSLIMQTKKNIHQHLNHLTTVTRWRATFSTKGNKGVKASQPSFFFYFFILTMCARYDPVAAVHRRKGALPIWLDLLPQSWHSLYSYSRLKKQTRHYIVKMKCGR